jgi:hypothetical protein
LKFLEFSEYFEKKSQIFGVLTGVKVGGWPVTAFTREMSLDVALRVSLFLSAATG